MQFYKVTNNLLIDFTCKSTHMVYINIAMMMMSYFDAYNANYLQRKNLVVYADYLSIVLESKPALYTYTILLTA